MDPLKSQIFPWTNLKNHIEWLKWHRRFGECKKQSSPGRKEKPHGGSFFLPFLLNSPIRASREEPLHWLSRFVSSYAPAPDSNQRLLALQTKLLIIAQWRTCNAHLLSREVSFFTRISIHPCILMIVITILCRFYRCTLLHMLKYFSRLQKC